MFTSSKLADSIEPKADFSSIVPTDLMGWLWIILSRATEIWHPVSNFARICLPLTIIGTTQSLDILSIISISSSSIVACTRIATVCNVSSGIALMVCGASVSTRATVLRLVSWLTDLPFAPPPALSLAGGRLLLNVTAFVGLALVGWGLTLWA